MTADEEQDPALADTDRPVGGSGRSAEAPAPESSYSAVPGALLAGKYRVVRALGKGGGGVVLEARHEQLDSAVAMKLLNPELVLQPDAAARFLREAKAAARLTSPHVTRVLDVGTLASGEPYLVMELLAGEDLASWSHRLRVAGEPPTVARVLDLMTQACAGVAAAHAAGVVHRDLKPANLFLTELTRGAKDAGVVKVLDFGVSKVIDLPTGEGGLTTTSTVLGSVLYMSPEQMRSSKHVDQRTDVYALGACLYELVCGRPPHEAASFAELCAKAYTEKPALLSTRRADLPAGLDAVVARALEHEPDARFASVAELVQALSPYATPSTRARMRALLDEHAPSLELLPVHGEPPRSRRSAPSLEVVPDADAAAVTRTPPPASGPWLPRGALVSGALFALVVGGASFFLWPDAPKDRPGAARPEASASGAASAAPREATAATGRPATKAPDVATPTASAAAPTRSSGTPTADPATPAQPSATPTQWPRTPTQQRATPTRPPATPTRPSSAPAPRAPPRPRHTTSDGAQIDDGLTQSRCIQHAPDGDHVVPCAP